ncbi:hypothetical protein Rhopal_005346-T1 [Rhodotorula paludigena]|uniref:F-box domain-containing protein n=1 Tax=Rhodotorula paludigena TaxID=86838 RepID=A0AAV5GI71_9BASI|nr:hypothetical protein Rhopal_005346-T1 [Rhodotorula paludigena]
MDTLPALPTELLLEIFRLSLVKSREKARRASLRSYSLVCKSWHAVAMPELYSGPLDLVGTDVLGGDATLTGRLHAEIPDATLRLVHSVRFQIAGSSRAEQDALRRLTTGMSHLRKLNIVRPRHEWDNCATGVVGIVRACKATLRSLTFTGAVPGGFTDLLNQLRVLEELHFVDQGSIPLALPPPKCRLRALTLRGQDLVATTLPYLVTPSNNVLASLVISLERPTSAHFGNAVNLPHLEHLERLELWFPDSVNQSTVDRFSSILSWASQLPALRSLVLSTADPPGAVIRPLEYFHQLPPKLVRLDLGTHTPPGAESVSFLENATWLPGLRVLRTMAKYAGAVPEYEPIESRSRATMEDVARKRGLDIEWIWPEDLFDV